jgi:hypothetical protein
MALIPKTLLLKLIDNAHRQNAVRGTAAEIDFEPVLKLFTPDAAATWLITEAEPDEHYGYILFGLADLGMGTPELGTVGFNELESFRGRLGLAVERDLYWIPKGPLSAYVDAALQAGTIVEPDIPNPPQV